MKTLRIVPPTSTTVGFPPKAGTWKFLQDSYTEIFVELMMQKIGVSYNTAIPYVVYGCTKSISGGNTNISKGLVFLNGNFYLSPAQTIVTPSGGNVLIANISTANYLVNADPVTFTDGNPYNVHFIETCGFASGGTGTGTIGDYTSFVFLDKWVDLGTSITFSGVGGTMTVGNVNYFKYKLDGMTLHLQAQLSNVTFTGSMAQVLLDLPSALVSQGFTFTNFIVQVCGVATGGATLMCKIDGGTGGDQFAFKKADLTNFTSANNGTFDFCIVTELSY